VNQPTEWGGVYKVGAPYQVKGVWYYPAVDYDYDVTGIASWYGADFHGKATANGEIYDMNALTAAHPTLPMPSWVMVTNLENGRTLKLRVNDRGPFVGGRIIDISRRGAQLLGFAEQGTTRVRVEIIAEESRALAEALTGGRPVAMAAATPVQQPQAEERSMEPTPVAASLSVAEGEPLPAREPAPAAVPLAAAGPIGETGGTPAYIQAGAFADIRNADRARSQLAFLGPVEVIRLESRNLYRVRIGPLESENQAGQLLPAVIRAGYPGSMIVTD
jgi:rare lipoprotein A